jgi:hypothetical protein
MTDLPNLPKKKERKEGKLQDSVMEYLRELCLKNDCQFGLTNHMSSYKDSGWPDITGDVMGLFVGIELKDIDGVQSQLQKKFKKKCEDIGGVYILAHSLEEVQAGLKTFHLTK